MNLRNTVDEQLAEIKDIRENEKELKNKLRESDQIEDRILTEMQNVKDEKIKLESTLEHKEKELAINVWILGEEDKNRILVGTQEISGGIDNNMFNFTLVFGEWELEEEEE